MPNQDLSNLFDLKGMFLGETLVEPAYLRYQVFSPEVASLELAFADAAALLERDVCVLQSFTPLGAATLHQSLYDRVYGEAQSFEIAA